MLKMHVEYKARDQAFSEAYSMKVLLAIAVQSVLSYADFIVTTSETCSDRIPKTIAFCHMGAYT